MNKENTTKFLRSYVRQHNDCYLTDYDNNEREHNAIINILSTIIENLDESQRLFILNKLKSEDSVSVVL